MGHWYKRDGEPCHYQKDGKNTTLRHARKQDLVPSVTTMLGIVAKPGLEKYKRECLLDAAFKADPLADFGEWAAEVEKKAVAADIAARDKGSAIDRAICAYYEGGVYDATYQHYVEAVALALEKVYRVGKYDVLPQRSFATLGYGGAVDLSNYNLILDLKYKSKGWECKKNGEPKQIWFDDHVAQLAAYRNGLAQPFKYAKCANVFIGPDAEVYIKEWTEEELDNGLLYFFACLSVWQRKNKWPS